MSENSNLEKIKELLSVAEENIKAAKQLIDGGDVKIPAKAPITTMSQTLNDPTNDGDDKIVEGIFDGEKMVDKTDQEYPVPANYASKSKLVPGDSLKLTIKPDGTFLYKQISPVERKRVIGTLTYEDGQYKVIANSKAYKVLLASVTYFKGSVGDKVTLIIADDEKGEWGAIENILPADSDIELSEI